MQLNLFGESTAPAEEAVRDPYAIDSQDIWELEFGPVTVVEAANDNAFLSAIPPEQQEQHNMRDEYMSIMRRQRLEALLEEVAIDESMLVSGFDGRRSHPLKPSLIPLLLDRVGGMSVNQLSLKYNRSGQYLYALLNRPSTRKFMAKVLAEFSVDLGDVKARLEAHATEAVDTVVDIMRKGKEENRQKSAFAILRMAGYDNNMPSTAITINNQPLDSGVVERTDKLLEALQQANLANTNGYEQYVEKNKRVAVREVAVVEAPAGILKLASAS